MERMGRIKAFDERNEALSTYFTRLKIYFKVFNIHEEEKVKLTLLLIGSKNYECLQNYLSPSTPESKSYEELEDCLLTHYSPPKLRIVRRYQFNTRNQLHGESISQYALSLKKLASSCDFGEFMETALLDRFVAGLRDQRIRKHLLAKDQNFKNAVREANNYCNLKHKQISVEYKQEVKRSKQMSKRNYILSKRPKSICVIPDSLSGKTCECRCRGKFHIRSCKDFTCKVCGIKHLQKECSNVINIVEVVEVLGKPMKIKAPDEVKQEHLNAIENPIKHEDESLNAPMYYSTALKGKMPYQCKKCDNSFWTQHQLEKHHLVHVLKKVTTNDAKKSFKCEVCEKEFRKICDLERHTRVHTGEKPSVCNICNKRFQQAYNLNKHLNIHTQEKNFECVICLKKFGRNDVLNRHVLTHCVDKPHQCSICSKTFIRQSQLNLHIAKHHQVRSTK